MWPSKKPSIQHSVVKGILHAGGPFDFPEPFPGKLWWGCGVKLFKDTSTHTSKVFINLSLDNNSLQYGGHEFSSNKVICSIIHHYYHHRDERSWGVRKKFFPWIYIHRVAPWRKIRRKKGWGVKNNRFFVSGEFIMLQHLLLWWLPLFLGNNSQSLHPPPHTSPLVEGLPEKAMWLLCCSTVSFVAHQHNVQAWNFSHLLPD